MKLILSLLLSLIPIKTSFMIIPYPDSDISISIRALHLYFATLQIETPNFNENAINDTTKFIKAQGVLQQTKIVIKDANHILGTYKYDTLSPLNFKTSTEIWLVIQNHYNPSFNITKGASLHIRGSTTLKGKYATWYVNKIKSIIKSLFNEKY